MTVVTVTTVYNHSYCQVDFCLCPNNKFWVRRPGSHIIFVVTVMCRILGDCYFVLTAGHSLNSGSGYFSYSTGAMNVVQMADKKGD